MSIIFHNPGCLDIRAVTTFGLSVKETDNPIGYFGTGLKYALAILLRHGCEVEIFTGSDRYEFTSIVDSFRGKECDLVYMSDPAGELSQLPFTLELGRDWELWQAYRELYCNAIDENGGVCDKHDEAKPVDDTTFVVVHGEAFDEVHAGRSSFINSEEPLYSCTDYDIVKTPGVYLKGIKISDSIFYGTRFGYNFKTGLRLTEDRSLADNYQAENVVKSSLAEIDNYDLTQAFLQSEYTTFEGQISWHSHLFNSDETKRALLDLDLNHPTKINATARDAAVNLREKEPKDDVHELTEVQTQAFEKAASFLLNHDIDVSDYPVKFVKTLGDSIWGIATDGTIILSAQVFDYGVKSLVATLYEEHLHLSKGFKDCTRPMQNHLFHTIVGLWEESDGETL